MNKKSVVIIGANRGIGLELAKYFYNLGWIVFGTARNPAEATELIQYSSKIFKLDLSSSESVEAFILSVKAYTQLSNAHNVFDMIVNNAGYFNKDKPVSHASLIEEQVINAISPFILTKSLIEDPMLNVKYVILMGSLMGSTANNLDGGHFGYRASKASAHSLFKNIAITYPHVKLIMIHPGHVQTDMAGALGKISKEQSIKDMSKLISKFLSNELKSGTLWNASTGLELDF